MPSAFVISAPATIFTAVTIAARKGVIVKGRVYVEKMAKVKAVAFDKTGTLTLGAPAVHDIKTAGELDQRVITYAAALEQFSNHPIAKAIVKKSHRTEIALQQPRGKRCEGNPWKRHSGLC
ncbi:MAG: cation-translocating P-type ATPase [Candidatus Brockarchaeota archaeon]|nr:cation-translocating P-type ATPase [Candidatus Brockarchaeota archaeon]